MLIVGERINSSRKSIAAAIASRDAAVIREEARKQADAGADYIDVNAGAFLGEEVNHLKWLMEVVQASTDKPLCIDSPDPRVIETVLPLAKQTPMINSITLDPARIEAILPLAVQRTCKVIALCQSEDRMAETADDKVRLATELIEVAVRAGLALADIHIDPLVYPLATNTQSASATLEAIDRIMRRFPGIHTTCGLTNVSYGLPNRRLVNRTFLVAAVARGLDSAILDPTDTPLFSALKAALLVMGQDDFCTEYVGAFRQGRLG